MGCYVGRQGRTPLIYHDTISRVLNARPESQFHCHVKFRAGPTRRTASAGKLPDLCSVHRSGPSPHYDRHTAYEGEFIMKNKEKKIRGMVTFLPSTPEGPDRLMRLGISLHHSNPTGSRYDSADECYFFACCRSCLLALRARRGVSEAVVTILPTIARKSGKVSLCDRARSRSKASSCGASDLTF